MVKKIQAGITAPVRRLLKATHWTLVAPALTTLAALMIWLLLAIHPVSKQQIWKIASRISLPISEGVVYAVAAAALGCAVGLYLYIDYKQHGKVAVLPKVLQNWEKGVYWLLHGMASIAALSLLIAFNVKPAQAYAPDEFVTTWKTDLITGQDQPDNYIHIGVDPDIPSNEYDYTIDWGDGNTDSGANGNAWHYYGEPGTYVVKITGEFPAFKLSSSNTQGRLLSIDQWGTNQWKTMNSAFATTDYNTTSSLVINATDTPNLSNVTDTSSMFFRAAAMDTDLSTWDVGNVQNMSAMFYEAIAFNQPLNSWDTSSATDISGMFYGASSFNQPLASWDISDVTNIGAMFRDTLFNQPLNSWNTSNVTDMSFLFYGTPFNQPLTDWETGNVTNMSSVFGDATAFNQPLDSWDTSNTTDMSFLFSGATAFNQPLNSWDTGNVTTMDGIFSGATAFNQPLGGWDISSLTELSFSSIPLSTANYDATLMGWSQKVLPQDMAFNAGSATYCTAATARQGIITTYHWVINDGGEDCSNQPPPDPEPEPESDSDSDFSIGLGSIEPQVELFSPADGDIYELGQEVELAAEASDEDGNIASVRFYVDGYLVGTDNAEPYQLQKQDGFPIGDHQAFAIAVDNDGAEATSEYVNFSMGEGPSSETVANVDDETVQKEILERTTNNQRSPAYSNNVTAYALTGPVVEVLQSLPWALLLLLALCYLVLAHRQHTQNQLLQQQLVVAQRTQDGLDSFLSIFSHYLRTPVTIMAGAIELLSGKATAKEATVSNALSTSIQQLQTYVHDLLARLSAATETVRQEVAAVEQNEPYSIRRWVIAPSIAAGLLMLISVVGLSSLGVWEAGFEKIIFAVLITAASVAGAVQFFKMWQHQLQLRQQLAGSLQVAQASLKIRQDVISESHSNLAQYEQNLSSSSLGLTQPAFQKTFSSGLGQFKKIVDVFGVVQQVTAQPAAGERVASQASALADTLTPLQQRAQAAGINLQLTIPASMTSPVSSDELQFVLRSLIDNAITFMPQGGQIDVMVECAAKGDLTIMATDTGAGIPQEKLDSLLQPFARGTDTGVYNYQGIGLSLYVTRLIAERYGGLVTIDSVVGKGTTVSFMVKSKPSTNPETTTNDQP